ncbi:MAG: DNA polymerase III subunit alpha [Pseudomonadota bacterium]
MSDPFVHLHVHSEYSLQDSVVRIPALVQQAAAAGMPAVALTDLGNLFALVRFYQAALAAGIKPIGGAELWLHNPDRPTQPFRLILLIQDDNGYHHLTHLISRSYQTGQQYGQPQIELSWLTPDNCTGLIALSGGHEGDVGQALLRNQPDLAARRLQHWQTLFGDRYVLQLARTGREHEEDYLHAGLALAATHQVPVVATNAVCFLQPEAFQAHEVRVCIQQSDTLNNPQRPRLYSTEQYLRTPAQMYEQFSDIPVALQNSVVIAQRCNLILTLGENYLPDFPIPDGMTIADYLQAEARRGLEKRLQHLLDSTSATYNEQRQPYDERLQHELDVINNMGFPGYFLIVADFIRWAKQQQIPVGPGRGSGAGSLVAYALDITDLDPLALELLFERFLNPERISMPDFDIDFCMDKRDSVIEYVAETYGRQAVAQIITFGSMAAKAVVRDVGRVMGHPYGFTDRVAKMIPLDLGITLTRALEDSDELKQAYTADEEVTQLIDMALELEGLARNVGKHAGGVVIAPGSLTDFSPLYCEPDGSNLVTQYDKDDVEQVGLVKFDFLGLRTLTIIDWALTTINAERATKDQTPIQIETIPLDDPQAFAAIRQADTTAIFQLESPGMKQLVGKLQPDCFDDIIALVALFRPGPLQSGMVDNFINRKHQREPIAYPDANYQHDCLKPILDSTYGIILYQEQVMQIAQVMAGYTLGEADLLRRAMGKKKPAEMAKQRSVFEQGAIKNGIDATLAIKIFDLVEKFAGYGFNKSHSAAYALLSYQTLWLKTHYPAAFMAAVLSADMDNTDKVVTLIEACRNLKLHIIPPDINQSDYRFTTAGEDGILYGLGAIKGVGEAAINDLLQTRTEQGSFRDLLDLCCRLDSRKTNRRVLEALVRAGALDTFGANRATLEHQLDLVLKVAEQQSSNNQAGMQDLFAAPQQVPVSRSLLPAPIDEWPEQQRLQGEKDTLGHYLSGHPMQAYATLLQELIGQQIGDLRLAPDTGYRKKRDDKKVSIAGQVVALRRRTTQRGQMASVLLEDATGRIEITLFSEQYEQHQQHLTPDAVLVASGSLIYDDYRGTLAVRADQIQPLADYRAAHTRGITLHLHHTDPATAQTLAGHLRPHLGGGTRLQLHYRNTEAEVHLTCGQAWRLTVSDTLLEQLSNWLGNEAAIQLDYTRKHP